MKVQAVDGRNYVPVAHLMRFWYQDYTIKLQRLKVNDPNWINKR